MPFVWSLLIIAGLLLLVYLMIAGVPSAPGERATIHGGRPRMLLPVLGTTLTAGGIAGYLLWQHAGVSPGTRFILVAAVAVLAAVGAGWLVRVSFAAPSNDPEDDPRYRWQGHVAHLTQAIPASHGGRGRVAFVFDGQPFDFPAVSIDGEPIDADTEVVVERIDDGLATVERWAVVEARL